ASDFVNGVVQFDAVAKAAGVFVLSGVSSFPILTAAVVRRLTRDFAKVLTIKGGIAPSPFAGVGINVILAITSYAGQPVKLLRGSRMTHAPGLVENLRYTVSPPGFEPLPNIRFSLVDVPDLQVLPTLWPELESVWMGAGTTPEILHRMLNGFSRLVHWKILPSLLPFAGIFHFVTNTVRWGRHRGGMFVEVRGIGQQGQPVGRTWHLLAEGNDGPYIPAMALQALVLRCAAGRKPPSGARPGSVDLELDDYEALFQARTIHTGWRECDDQMAGCTNYQRLLGPRFASLPAPIRQMHDWYQGGRSAGLRAEGKANIERGTSLLSRLIARVVGFPQAGQDVPVQVKFENNPEGEVWTRSFAGKSFFSVQSLGQGRSQHLIEERFGPAKFGLALVMDQDSVRLKICHWRLFGIKLPLAWSPKTESREYVEDGQYRFHIEISHPWVGLIVRYRGYLRVVA
ncbi:MAG: hypothetical protein RL748_1570, partial [Pseudomonadota bacterium]